MSAGRDPVANGGATSRSLATRAQFLPRIVGWLAFVLLAIAIVVLRRPESLTNAAFFYEDGQVFYIGAFFGSPLDQLTRQYEGYLHVIPRLVAMLERLAPQASAPLIGNAIALLVVVGVAAYIASGRLANVIPERRTRVLLAIVFLLLPGAWETLGSMTLVQWYLAIFLLLAGIAGAPRGRIGSAAELVAIAFAGLTGPFSLLFAPVYWVRAWRSRDSWSITTAGLVTLVGVVQLTVLLFSGERSGQLPSLQAIGEFLTVRLWASVLGGFWMSGLIPMGIPIGVAVIASLLLLAGIVLAATAVPRMLVAALAFGALVIVWATMLDHPFGLPVSPYLAGRYVVMVSVLVAFTATLALVDGRQRRPAIRGAALAVGSLVLFGIVGDFRLPAHPDYGWAEHAGCIGGPVPCDVPVEFPSVWTVHWPGTSGTYIQPNP